MSIIFIEVIIKHKLLGLIEMWVRLYDDVSQLEWNFNVQL